MFTYNDYITFEKDVKDSILFNQDETFKDVTNYNENEWEDFFNE